jgi:hypothetical protein
MALRRGFTTQPFEVVADLVDDPAIKDSLDRIRQFFDSLLMARFNGDHFEVTFSQQLIAPAVTAFTFEHNLGYLPQDLWVTSQTGDSATVSPNYNSFNATTVAFDITGLALGDSVTIRFFAGSFVDAGLV